MELDAAKKAPSSAPTQTKFPRRIVMRLMGATLYAKLTVERRHGEAYAIPGPSQQEASRTIAIA